MKFLYHLIATFFGAGYFPLGPGTVGSVVCAVAVYFLIPDEPFLLILILAVLFAAGVVSGTAMEKWHGKDPSLVVIDEVVGMGISLVLVPRNWLYYLIAFVLFRFFDIVKLWPANISQNLKGGWGIVTDDVIAGIYALILVHFMIFIIF